MKKKKHNYLKWKSISKIKNLPENFLKTYKDKIDWNEVSQYTEMSESFLEEMKDYGNWVIVCYAQKLSEPFIEKMSKYIYWHNALIYQDLSEDFVRKHIDVIRRESNLGECKNLTESLAREYFDYKDVIYILIKQNVSIDFIREICGRDRRGFVALAYNNNVDKRIFNEFCFYIDDIFKLTDHVHLPEDYIRRFKFEIGMKDILQTQKLSEPFIEELETYFCDKKEMFWELVGGLQSLSEPFIEKHWNDLHKDNIVNFQELSEEFIEKHYDAFNWDYLSKSQRLSEQFIDKWKDYVNWTMITKYQKLSEDFVRKHKDYVDWNFVDISNFSLEFIDEFWDSINKKILTFNFEYVKKVLNFL